MAYKANAPADDEFLADFPAEQREQHRAIVNDKIVNAGKLNGLTSGNASGNIPVSNGTKCTNLNADLLDGHDSTYFATSGHTHDAATQSSNGLMSNTDKKKLDGIATGAEVNQNAFANVKVGSTTIQADAKQDTLTLEAGDHISVTPDATNDKVTVSATGLLPLSGGTMTGTIRSNTNANIDATSSTRIEETVTSGVDKNGANLGANFYSAVNTDVFNALRASNPNFNNGENWADIRLHVNSEGKRFISTDYHGSLTDGTTDNSNHIPTTAFIHGKYLSLSGGTMTGNLAADMNEFWIGNKKANNAGIITLRSANDSYKNGAVLTLQGIGASGAGQFTLQAADGTNTPSLLGKADGTLKWNNSDIALAKDYLPLAGGTLTGDLTFSGTGAAPITISDTGTAYRDIQIVHTDGNRVGVIRFARGNTANSITIGASDAKNSAPGGLAVIRTLGDGSTAGTVTVEAPTPESSDNSKKVATTAFVNTKVSGYLPLSGGTMTGSLNTKQIHNRFSFAKGTVPSAKQYASIYFSDNAGNNYSSDCIGLVESSVSENNLSRTYIRAVKNEANSTVNCEISCNVDQNGKIYTSAPTPDSSDDSTKIATTAFVKGLIGATGGSEGISAKGTNYIRYVSGLQICFGAVSSSSFSFPQPFNDVPAISHIATSGDWTRIKNLTKTSAEVSVGNGYYIAVGYWK